MCSGVVGGGWNAEEGGTNLSPFFVLKKKKRANLHHDFLTNLGEGGLPAWSCLIWRLGSRTNVRPSLRAPARPHPRGLGPACAAGRVLQAPP